MRLEQLKERFALPLPGESAQLKMSSKARKLISKSPTNAKLSAVLVLLYPKNKTWTVLFMERAKHDKDKHSGQISFPGGRYEKEDGTYEVTALRESMEEVGIAMDSVEVLGRLTPLYIPVSNYEVFPVVGISTLPPIFNINKREVERIIEIPLDYLQSNQSKTSRTMTLGNGLKIDDVPCFKYESTIVWGATAMILSELLDLLKAGELPS